MENNYFLNSQKFAIREIRQIPYEKPFFPRQAIPTTFLHYTLITLVILNTEFDLIWTTPWPAEEEFFSKFSKIGNSRNSQNSVWKLNFSLGTLYQKSFRFTLSLHWWYSIPRLVWFGQLLNPMKKKLFSKFLFREIRKSSVRKSNFFSEATSNNFFCFTLSLHCWYSIPSLVWFGQLLDPLKKN